MRRPAMAAWWRGTRLWAVPAALLLALALPSLRGGDWRVDTGRYSALGLSAVRDGAWWSLSAGDQPYFNKPPLAFWIHGVALDAFGPSLWAARLPVVLAAAGCVVATVFLVRRLSGPRVAMATGIVLALTLEWFRHARQLSLDIWQTLLMLLAMLCVARGVRSGTQAPVALSGLFIGLALLVKPLMALVAIPLLGVWLVSTGRARLLKGLAASVAIALAVALPWHLSMVAQHGRAFTDQYFGSQVVGRATGELFAASPWWWYASHFARTYWPWLATLALAIVAFVRRGVPRRDREALLLALVWCGAWLLLLSAFADKRARYALMLYPLLAVPSAVWLVKLAPLWARRGRGRKRVDAGALCAALVGLALVFTPLRLHDAPDKDWGAVNAFLREQADAPVYDASLDLADRSRLYLARGRWSLSLIRADGSRATPPSGAFVVMEPEADAPAPDFGEVALRAGDLLVVRVR